MSHGVVPFWSLSLLRPEGSLQGFDDGPYAFRSLLIFFIHSRHVNICFSFFLNTSLVLCQARYFPCKSVYVYHTWKISFRRPPIYLSFLICYRLSRLNRFFFLLTLFLFAPSRSGTTRNYHLIVIILKEIDLSLIVNSWFFYWRT